MGRLSQFLEKDGAVWRAGLLAVLMLVVSGISYRVAAARYDRFANPVPLAKNSLSLLPHRIGEWGGEDLPLDGAVFSLLGVDAYVNRMYSRPGASHPIALFISYSTHPRDVLAHRPEICYPSAGWARTSTKVLELPVAQAERLLCQKQTFQRGGLGDRQACVLSYYLVDSVPLASISDVRNQLLMARGGAPYVFLVQFILEAEAIGEDEMGLLEELAVASASDIALLQRNAVAAAPKGRSQEP